jgi:hypothetical protein
VNKTPVTDIEEGPSTSRVGVPRLPTFTESLPEPFPYKNGFVIFNNFSQVPFLTLIHTKFLKLELYGLICTDMD